MKRHRRCRIGGSFGAGEIPLLLLFFYLFELSGAGFASKLLVLTSFAGGPGLKTLSGGEFGCLGAAHLLNDNAGVLRGAHGEQKSPVEQKGKSPLDFDFQCEYKP